MRRVPIGDFRLGSEEREAINEVMTSGRLSEGPKVLAFEREWARYVGTNYCVATSSGTAALVAGLTALRHSRGLKRAAKIITTPLTFAATANAIVNTGFEPVFVDVDPVTFGITPQAVESHLAEAPDPENYAAILPVHLIGYPVPMDAMNRIAGKYNLVTFEDSAQAHGSEYKGRKVGSMSLLSDFSFYMAHTVQGGGEMGAVTTDDPEIDMLIQKIKRNGLACNCKACRRHAGDCPHYDAADYPGYDMDPHFSHDIIGYNFKTMEFQGAFALTQIKKIDWILRRRRENVAYLNEKLERFCDIVQLPLYSEHIGYLAYPLIIKGGISRAELRVELERRGVESRPLFGSLPTQQPAFAYLKEAYQGHLPNAERLGANGLYIGCHQYLEREDLDWVAECFSQILGRL